MPVIPPWIAVNPKDFVAASQAGGELGSKIASLRTEANLNSARLASSERENAARIAASSEQAAAARAQAASDSDVARAIRQYEFAQRMGLDQSQLEQSKLAEADRNALGLKTLTLGENRLDLTDKRDAELARAAAAREQIAQNNYDLMSRRQDEVERRNAELASRPQLRVVENQLVQYNPITGTTESLFSAPFRPSTASLMEDFLNGTATGTNGAPTAPTAPTTIRPPVTAPKTNEVIRTGPDGRRIVYDAETKQPLRYAE